MHGATQPVLWCAAIASSRPPGLPGVRNSGVSTSRTAGSATCCCTTRCRTGRSPRFRHQGDRRRSSTVGRDDDEHSRRRSSLLGPVPADICTDRSRLACLVFEARGPWVGGGNIGRRVAARHAVGPAETPGSDTRVPDDEPSTTQSVGSGRAGRRRAPPAAGHHRVRRWRCPSRRNRTGTSPCCPRAGGARDSPRCGHRSGRSSRPRSR